MSRRKEGDIRTHKHREETIKKEAHEATGQRLEWRCCGPQSTRGGQQLPEARGEARTSSPWKFQKDPVPSTPWSRVFSLQNCERRKFCCFKATRFVVTWYNSPRKLMKQYFWKRCSLIHQAVCVWVKNLSDSWQTRRTTRGDFPSWIGFQQRLDGHQSGYHMRDSCAGGGTRWLLHVYKNQKCLNLWGGQHHANQQWFVRRKPNIGIPVSLYTS